jgi:HlyD family secretion protein
MTTMNTKAVEEVEIADIVAGEATIRVRRRWLKWLAAAVVAAGALAAFAGTQLSGRSAVVRYETQPAKTGSLTVAVAATGNLQPINQVNVGSELSGSVRSVHAQVNDRVRAGQVLARLDTSKLEAQIQQADASLASARARVLQAEATVRESEASLARLRRLRDLTGGRTPSSADLEGAEAAFARAQADEATARASVSQAAAALAVLQTDLSKAVIRSPTSGIVLTRTVEPGQTVAASLQAPELFLLAEDLTRMELHVSVDEADVGRVKAGQEATFTVAAYPDRKYQARITRVHYGSTTTGGVVTYETVLQVANPDLSLRPGMTGTAEIVTEKLEDALIVPNAALRFRPEEASGGAQASQAKSGSGPGLLSALVPRPPVRARGPRQGANRGSGGQARVWILQEGQPVPVAVKTGLSDGLFTELREGDVAPGTALVVGTATGRK